MKIAQVAPLYESVPPKAYGGIERVVSYLTEQLIREGHSVTVFASGDSITSGELVACCPKSISQYESWMDPMAFHALQLYKVFERTFDIVHFHIEYLSFPFCKIVGMPSVTTLHGPLPDIPELFRVFKDLPFISISNAQRAAFSNLNWRGTIHHGLPPELYTFKGEPGKYLAFLGRIAPEKGCDHAIAIAKKTAVPIKIAAKIDPYDHPYFDSKIKPLFRDPLVEFIGEIGEREKNELLGNALALLFPIDWPEPFGLVMIEALACGTPVIAYRRGSVPEVIEDGVSGRIVDDVEGAAAAVEEIGRISRHVCRQKFEARFTASRMAREYVSVYRSLVDSREACRASFQQGCPDYETKSEHKY